MALWIFYVDESGTGLGAAEKRAESKQPYFVLAAAGMLASRWHEMDEAIYQLKKRHLPYLKPTDFELKGRDIRQGTGVFRQLSWSVREALFSDVVDFVAELPCKVVAVIADKRHLPTHMDSVSLYRMAFWRLLSELKAQFQPRGDQILLMMDSRSDLHSSVQDKRLVEAFIEWQNENRGPFIETPWFGFSAFYAGLQVADVLAYLLAWEARESLEGRKFEARRLLARLPEERLRVVEV